METLLRDLRVQAQNLGFQRVGVTSPSASEHMGFYREWVRNGHHGEMAYLARPDSMDRRGDLRLTMEQVKSVVVLSQEYSQPDFPGIPEDQSRGVLARYARGQDYHDLVKGRLQELLAWINREARSRGLAEEVQGFPYVDTGPILERDLGRRAGLGWFGKNTMLITPRRGSYFFLGLLLLDLPFPFDDPFRQDHCGTCKSCLKACPTGALLGLDSSEAPVMDARRCISYLTIELKGPIPRELRSAMENRIFGCDICQEVCPWNQKFAAVSPEPAFQAGPDTEGPALVELMGLSPEEFATRFSGSPVKRAKRRGFLRNVAVALGNWGSIEAVPVLARALGDQEPLVRGHAAWALGEILGKFGASEDWVVYGTGALRARLDEEEDPWVMDELEWALQD